MREPKRQLPAIYLLIGISALGPITMNGVLPANSAVMAEFATHYGMVQLVFSVFLAATLVAQIVFGYAADRFGRRPVMITSLAIFGVGGLLCAAAGSIESLLVARFIQGLGASVCSFLPRTIVRDVYGRDRAASVIGYMTTAMMIAPMFGPAMGGWITDNASWRWMYAGLGFAGLLACILSWRFQHETQAPASHGSEWHFLAYALMMMGSVGIYYCILAGAPFVIIENRGFTASSYGAWFAFVAVGYTLGNLCAGRFSVRLGVDRMILLGLIPGTFGVLLFWLLASWHHPLGLLLPMQLVAFSNGASLPNMSSAAMSVKPHLAASASGLAGSLQVAFGILLTVVLGMVLPDNDLWLYVLITFSALVCAIGVLINVVRH